MTSGTIRNPQSAIRNYVDLARPFTLVAPALGFVSGALTAIAHPQFRRGLEAAAEGLV